MVPAAVMHINVDDEMQKKKSIFGFFHFVFFYRNYRREDVNFYEPRIDLVTCQPPGLRFINDEEMPVSMSV